MCVHLWMKQKAYFWIQWNGNVLILMKFSSLAALDVVKMTTSSAANDENFFKMTTFSSLCTLILFPSTTPLNYSRFGYYGVIKPTLRSLIFPVFRNYQNSVCLIRHLTHIWLSNKCNIKYGYGSTAAELSVKTKSTNEALITSLTQAF